MNRISFANRASFFEAHFLKSNFCNNKFSNSSMKFYDSHSQVEDLISFCFGDFFCWNQSLLRRKLNAVGRNILMCCEMLDFYHPISALIPKYWRKTVLISFTDLTNPIPFTEELCALIIIDSTDVKVSGYMLLNCVRIIWFVHGNKHFFVILSFH